MLESELTTECIAVQAGDQYLSFRRNNLSLHLFLKTKQNTATKIHCYQVWPSIRVHLYFHLTPLECAVTKTDSLGEKYWLFFLMERLQKVIRMVCWGLLNNTYEVIIHWKVTTNCTKTKTLHLNNGYSLFCCLIL